MMFENKLENAYVDDLTFVIGKYNIPVSKTTCMMWHYWFRLAKITYPDCKQIQIDITQTSIDLTPLRQIAMQSISIQNPIRFVTPCNRLVNEISQVAKFMGPTWCTPGSCRSQMGPMLAPWTLLSGMASEQLLNYTIRQWVVLSIC